MMDRGHSSAVLHQLGISALLSRWQKWRKPATPPPRAVYQAGLYKPKADEESR